MSRQHTAGEIQRTKARVRQRDGMRCTRCGLTNEQHLERYGKILEVHRLRPGSFYTLAGCITLCKTCHTFQARRRKGEPDLEARPRKTAVSGFGKNLRVIRKRAGLSQRTLEELAGLTRGQITHIENGRWEPNWFAALSLAEALGISTEEFRKQV